MAHRRLRRRANDLAAIDPDGMAKGPALALDEPRELGMVGEAGTGRGFGDIALSGLEPDAEGLTGAFGSFRERRERGELSLIDEGDGFALKAGPAAGTSYGTDQHVEGALKAGVNSVVGNPYASEEEITGKDWRQVLSSDAFTRVRGADYGKEPIERARENGVTA